MPQPLTTTAATSKPSAASSSSIMSSGVSSRLPPTAQPRLGRAFDPWNSVGAGHQRAEGRRVGTGWRDLRTAGLQRQMRERGPPGPGQGGDRGRSEDGAGPLVAGGKRPTVAELLMGRPAGEFGKPGDGGAVFVEAPSASTTTLAAEGSPPEPACSSVPSSSAAAAPPPRGGIFAGLTVYVNGSTAPLISDHRLKQRLVSEGASLAIHLGRRRVTHVVVGRPNGVGGGGGGGGGGVGCGGGLAAGKLEKEIRRVGGCGVKFVGVEW